MSAANPGVGAAIAGILGCDAAVLRSTPLAGSALNTLWRVDAGEACAFVKLNEASALPMFEAEAEGLAELGAANTARVPRVLGCGIADAHAFLVLEWLDLAAGRGARGAALGGALAGLHRRSAVRFGWHRDNTIGTTPQPNGWMDDWGAFFRERRLRPQLELARRNGYVGGPRPPQAGDSLPVEAAAAASAAALDALECERLLSITAALLEGHAPQPSLLHGDLWSGNAAALADGTSVLLDPAVYFGDREADLAMTELFGGFDADFYAAYRAAWPLAPGYARRRTLYNLYHVLNHLNLFGGGYGAQARAMMRELLASVQRTAASTPRVRSYRL